MHQTEPNPTRIIKTKYDLSLHELRHVAISQILTRFNITRLLDLGCNHGQLLQRIARSPNFTLLAGMDKDPVAVGHTIRNLQPEPIQTSIRYSRNEDMKVLIFEGDLLEPYKELKDLQVEMVSMVEVIEHLQCEQIPKANQTVFGFLRPQYVVITTPNREFNVHFDKPQAFRHWDHKFEWTRQEFKRYCEEVSLHFGYSHQISGIGEHVSDPSKGCCSQMAVFTLTSEKSTLEPSNTPIKLAKQYIFKCWRSDLKSIMRDQFYKGITYNPNPTFEEVVTIIRQHPNLSECLEDQLDVDFLKKWITEFADIFTWDQEGYRLKEIQSSEDSLQSWDPIQQSDPSQMIQNEQKEGENINVNIQAEKDKQELDWSLIVNADSFNSDWSIQQQ